MKKLLLCLAVICILSSASVAQTLVLGNPSNANDTDTSNLLVVHSGFVLSYNQERGGANWVSWHLSASDIGNFRTDAFAPDMLLPAALRIKPKDLSLKGFDRGHLCPSEDRSAIEAANRETFVMSNMIPKPSNSTEDRGNPLKLLRKRASNRATKPISSPDALARTAESKKKLRFRPIVTKSL